jgi:hypothetical protein
MGAVVRKSLDAVSTILLSIHGVSKKRASQSYYKPDCVASVTKTFALKGLQNIPLKVGCLHPVACTRSGSGFPSNVKPVLH